MRKRFLKTAAISLILCCVLLVGLTYEIPVYGATTELETEVEVAVEETQSHCNKAQPVQMLLGTELDDNNSEEKGIKVLGVYLTQDEIQEIYEKEKLLFSNSNSNEQEVTEEVTVSQNFYGLTDDEIIMVTNVVMHEVGGIYGPNTYVVLTYANGQSTTYSNSCILHQIHAQVLINQYHSSLFPSSLANCIRNYWMAGLDSLNYYNHSNSTWQHCKNDIMNINFTIPSNVFGATCDPYFASRYPGYSLYASVYWNTGWYSGTFYYYQYNG